MNIETNSDSDDFQVVQQPKPDKSKFSFFDGLCSGNKLSDKQKKMRQKVREQSEMNVNQSSLKQKIDKNKKYKSSNRNEQQQDLLPSQTKQNFSFQKVFVDTQNKPSSNFKQTKRSQKSFQQLRIIKPLLKAINDFGYINPTPIQQQAIPVISSGKDVVASSITGSGKTAAFLLPIIQRYFHAAAVGYIRALIVTPTRQLAIQIHEQFQKLNKYTKLQSCLVIGGSSIQRQQQILRNNPEVVISTPGRIIDLVMNSRSIGIQNLQMIVFDEADKLLELGFQAQIKQIMSHTHQQVQTILFSATISKQINKLATITSKKPIRISADPDHKTAQLLHQQVIKLKSESDEYREAVLVSILQHLYKQKVIIFFKTKKQCHRIAIILGLLGLQSCQLHGNLSQTQRIQAFLDFKQGKYQYMLATDLAARGLDIKQVKAVVNFQLPVQLTRYIHRIGRTARAGSIGTSLTLCNDMECLQLKKMSKKTGDKLFKLNVRDDSVNKTMSDIASLQSQISNILFQQRQQRQLRKAQMQIKKAENINDHQQQIMNRPKREWFMSQKQKKNIQDKAMLQIGLQPLNNTTFEQKKRSFSDNKRPNQKRQGFKGKKNFNESKGGKNSFNKNKKGGEGYQKNNKGQRNNKGYQNRGQRSTGKKFNDRNNDKGNFSNKKKFINKNRK